LLIIIHKGKKSLMNLYIRIQYKYYFEDGNL